MLCSVGWFVTCKDVSPTHHRKNDARRIFTVVFNTNVFCFGVGVLHRFSQVRLLFRKRTVPPRKAAGTSWTRSSPRSQEAGGVRCYDFVCSDSTRRTSSSSAARTTWASLHLPHKCFELHCCQCHQVLQLFIHVCSLWMISLLEQKKSLQFVSGDEETKTWKWPELVSIEQMWLNNEPFAMVVIYLVLTTSRMRFLFAFAEKVQQVAAKYSRKLELCWKLFCMSAVWNCVVHGQVWGMLVKLGDKASDGSELALFVKFRGVRQLNSALPIIIRVPHTMRKIWKVQCKSDWGQTARGCFKSFLKTKNCSAENCPGWHRH